MWWDNVIDLLMLTSLLSSVKTFIYSSVNDLLIFLKFEKNNINTSILRFTIVSLGEFQWLPAKKYGIISLQAYRWRPNSSSGTAEINIITRTKDELDFLSSVLQADFYCWDPGRWLAYHLSSSAFLIRQGVFTRRVLFHSVLPLSRNASSNSFVFHILLFLFNMIFRI